MRVVVTGTNVAGDDTASSAPTAAVDRRAAGRARRAPSISGTTVDGQTLTADPGTFSGTGPLDYDYQWQRCDADGTTASTSPGADGLDLRPRLRRRRRRDRVVVTATNGAGSDGATSVATGEVLAARARQRHPAEHLRRPARRRTR